MSVAPELRTYRDALDDLRDWCDTLQLEAGERRLRRAVRDGLREMGLARPWKYYRKIRQIDLVAPWTGESGATVAYDHAGGGTCERQLTLTPGASETWPDNVREYEVVLDAGTATVLYPIAEWKSATVVQLAADRNPGADVAAGTFSLYKMGYPVDGDVQKIFELHDERGIWGGGYVHPDRWLHQVRSLLTTQSYGFQWTLLGDDDSYGQLEFRFYGLPGAAQTLQFLADCAPRRLRYTGYADAERSGSVATVAGTSGLTAIVGTGTSFNAKMIGTVLRIGEDGSEPDLLLSEPDEEKIITAVTDTTHLTVHSAVSSTFTGRGFYISDPLDVPKYLQSFFTACCRLELAQLLDPHELKRIEGLYDRARWQAEERDEGMVEGPATPAGWVAFKIPTWARLVAL
ncbi:MAG TPA: hypothetical protein VM243_11900 [Phycisphaerae bacterium]|nr:hypothetical protein [Phycisphaerae bacterium]